MISSTKKSIYFIADADSDRNVQRDLVKSISQFFNVVLMWNAKSNCNFICHPIKNVQPHTEQKITDIGHVDIGMFKDIIEITLGLSTDPVIVSVNEISSDFQNFPLVLINLPSVNSSPLAENLKTLERVNSSSKRNQQVLILCNTEDAFYSLREFNTLFDLYQIMNLEFDQVGDKVRFPKSEISKVIELISNIN